MRHVLKACFLGVFSALSPAVSEIHHHGTHGMVFEIQERSLLEVMQERLQKAQERGALEAWRQKNLEVAQDRMLNPPCAVSLPQATQTRRFEIDPSLRVSQDILDHKGNPIVKAGTVINPLDFVAWGADLVFLDGEDASQVAWAQRHAKAGKWVLTRGKPLALESVLKRRIYFDQGARLSKRFKLQHLPARVFQEDKKLVVEEVKLQLRQT